MSGAPGIETAIGGSPTAFVLARAGTPPHLVRADPAGGARDIMRLPACAPLLTAVGGVPSVTILETFGVMSVAKILGTAVAVTSAAIATNGVTSGVSGATVAPGVTSAMIVVKTVGASAVMIAVKITSVRSAVIPATTVAASAGAVRVHVRSAVNAPKFPVEIMLARSAGPMTPVGDRTAATAQPEKRAAIVEFVRRAAEERATAATAIIVDGYRRPHSAMRDFLHGLCATPGGAQARGAQLTAGQHVLKNDPRRAAVSPPRSPT